MAFKACWFEPFLNIRHPPFFAVQFLCIILFEPQASQISCHYSSSLCPSFLMQRGEPPTTGLSSTAQIRCQTCLALERESHSQATCPAPVKLQTGTSASHQPHRQVQSSLYLCPSVSSSGAGPLVVFQGRRKTVDANKSLEGCTMTQLSRYPQGSARQAQFPVTTKPHQDISGPTIPNDPPLGAGRPS